MEGMGPIAWIVLGALSGLVAKTLLPGRNPSGCILTTIVGILGSLLGGFFATWLGFGGFYGFDWRSLIIASVGSLVLLYFTSLSRRLLNRPSAFSSERAEPSFSSPRQTAWDGSRKGKATFQQPPSRVSQQTPVQSQSHPKKEVPQQPPVVQPSASSQRRGVFISYRRADSADVTGRLYDRLVARFSSRKVFKDVDSIPLGVDFRRHIENEVSACSVLLVIIGKTWLGPSEGRAGFRIHDPGDFVRIEVEAALKRDIPVIPVLVQGATLPAERDLPSSLQTLVYRNSISIRSDPDFHRDVDRLVAHLAAHVQ